MTDISSSGRASACANCGGRGWILDYTGVRSSPECPACNGTGAATQPSGRAPVCANCGSDDAEARSGIDQESARVRSLGQQQGPELSQDATVLPSHITPVLVSRLRRWANRLRGRYGVPIYLCGSALREDNPDPRDWDVRIMLPDDDFALKFGPVDEWRAEGCTGNWTRTRFRWSDQCVKDTQDFAAWVQLNGDVQFYPESHAATLYADKPRFRLDTFPEGEQGGEDETADLTRSHGYGSPADVLAWCARRWLKELASPEHPPVYGPTAARAIAATRGAEIMEALAARAAHPEKINDAE